MWTDCTTCFEGCASVAGECSCLGGAGEAGLPLLFILAIIVLGLFTVIGIFYSVLVATMVGQRIWQRHYHILAKRMLTKVSSLYLIFLCLLSGLAIVLLYMLIFYNSAFFFIYYVRSNKLDLSLNEAQLAYSSLDFGNLLRITTHQLKKEL